MSTLTNLFTDIADSLRAKEGSTGQIPAMDFPERIDGLAGKMQVVDESGESYDVIDIDYNEEKGKPIVEKIVDMPSDYQLVNATSDEGFIIANSDNCPSKLLLDGSIQWSITSEYYVDCINDAVYVVYSDLLIKYDINGSETWTVTDSKIRNMSDYAIKIIKIDNVIYVFATNNKYIIQINDDNGSIIKSGYSFGNYVRDIWKDGSIYSTSDDGGHYLYVYKQNKNLTHIWSYISDYAVSLDTSLCLSNKGYPYVNEGSASYGEFTVNKIDINSGNSSKLLSGRCSFNKNKKNELFIIIDYSSLKVNVEENINLVLSKDIILNKIGDTDLTSTVNVNTYADRITAVVSYNGKYYVCRPNSINDCTEKIFEITNVEYTVLSSAKQMQNENTYGVSSNSVYKITSDISKETAVATLNKKTT